MSEYVSEVQEETAKAALTPSQRWTKQQTEKYSSLSKEELADKFERMRKLRALKEQRKTDPEGKNWKVHPYSDIDFDFAKAVERLKAAGLSDDDLVWVFGLSNLKQIDRWKVGDPAFREACLRGKEIAAHHLVAAGFRAAVGYDYEDSAERYTIDKETGEPVFVGRTVYKRHYPPDISILTFLLCNLDKKWRSPTRLEIRNEMKTLNVTVDGKLDSKRIEQLARKLLPPDTENNSRKPVMATEIGSGAGG